MGRPNGRADGGGAPPRKNKAVVRSARTGGVRGSGSKTPTPKTRPSSWPAAERIRTSQTSCREAEHVERRSRKGARHHAGCDEGPKVEDLQDAESRLALR